MVAKRASRKNKANREKKNSWLSGGKEATDKVRDLVLTGLGERTRSYLTVAAWLALVLDIALIGSILTDWTGLIGVSVRRSLLGEYGGGVLIILVLIFYVCLSAILHRTIPKPMSQAMGAVSLYFCAVLLLGLLDLAGRGRAAAHILLTPGRIGRSLASWSFINLGPLGTTLMGLVALAVTLTCFGFTGPFRAALDALRGRVKKKSARDKPKESDYLEAETEENDEQEGDLQPVIDLPRVTEPDIGTGEFEPSELQPGQFPPPIELFGKERDDDDVISEETARPWGERIIDSLEQFGIEAELAEILVGPTVVQFRIQPSPGVKVSRIVGLANDLALALAVSSLRVEAPIPGKPYVGIEIPNPKRRGIMLRSILERDEYQETDKALPLPMGVTINGDPLIVGLEELPHLLVAGTTGSGKSVFVNSCIIGLCSMRRPDELKMVLVDPKRVEMAVYEKLPHILTPPVTDPKKAVHVLGWAIREMERRYSCFAERRVRNLASHNEIVLPKDRLPHIVIVVDELADLMMTAAKEVEEYICRLAQMARATGIHLILATQRPSVNVITGLIKANVPARVAFTLPSMMDSRTILDSGGAEKLLGKGDMLFLSTHYPKPVRVQASWIDEYAVNRWLGYLINLFGEPIYTDIDDQSDVPAGFENGGSFDDALLGDAVRAVVTSGMASASGLQRRLRVGFTRAGRLVDMMEAAGIVGPADGARPREILVDEEEAEEILDRIRGMG